MKTQLLQTNPELALKALRWYPALIVPVALIMHSLAFVNPTYTMLYLSLGCLVIALIFLFYVVRYGKGLDKLRFGGVAIHALTYAVVAGGNLLHFAIDALFQRMDLPSLLATWSGLAVVLGGLWGLGLAIHIIGVIAGRGYEASTAVSIAK